MPTRAVTILCLVQVGLLLLAWMLTSKFTGLMEKFGTGGPAAVPTMFPRFRDYGLFLLMVPVGVALLCTMLTRAHRDIAIPGQGGFYLAVFSTIAVACFAAFITYLAYHNAFESGLRRG